MTPRCRLSTATIAFGVIGIAGANAETPPSGARIPSLQGLVDEAAANLVSAGANQFLTIPRRIEVRVTPNQYPLDIKRERTSDGSIRLSIPTGFFVVTEDLVDATLMARAAGREDDALAYADSVVMFAAMTTRDRHGKPAPQSVCNAIQWTEARCLLTRQTDTYRNSRSQMHLRSIGWIIAHQALLADVMADPHQRTPQIDAGAADWTSRAGIVPLPIPAVSIFYAATLEEKPSSSKRWRCRAGDFVAAGVATLRTFGAQHALTFDVTAAALSRRDNMTLKLRTSGNCSSTSINSTVPNAHSADQPSSVHKRLVEHAA